MAHFQSLHEWNLSPAEAVALQQQLRSQIRIEPLTKTPKTIAGCDISLVVAVDSNTVFPNRNGGRTIW